MSLNFGKILSLTSELAALERLKKSMDNVVTTLNSGFYVFHIDFRRELFYY